MTNSKENRASTEDRYKLEHNLTTNISTEENI